MKTWGEILQLTTQYLEAHSVPDAMVAAELLVARLLRCGRGLLASKLSLVADDRFLMAMRRGMTRLAQGEPIQYVLGEWDFRRLTLTCDKRALIPRPETEELVTRVLAHLKKREAQGKPAPLVVDVGTGSGCILLALAQEWQGEASFLGLDISPDAIQLAKENAKRCGLENRVTFQVADGLDDFDEPESIDVLVSNPPYITTTDCDTLDPRIRNFEPKLALDGGVTGLDFYERFVEDALNLLKSGGAVFFEIGDNQGESVKKLFFDAGFDKISVEKDFSGHDRYVSAILP